MATFEQMDVQVLGISVDSVPCLQAWAESLGGISYPLLSDFWPHGAVSESYGVMRGEGYSERALFLIDREGKIRYIDIHDIEDQPDNAVIIEEIRKIEPGASAGGAPDASQAKENETEHEPDVILYCTRWCPGCRIMRRWLDEHEIAYREIDVGGSPEAAEKVRGWANGKVITPTLDFRGTVVVNLDWDKLDALVEE